jgi:membrane fusion protein, copper/silver efflux system
MDAAEQGLPERESTGAPLAEGAESPPPGVRAMAIVRWSLVGLMAVAAIAAGVHVARPASGATSRVEAQFHCPMHPSVVQDRGGDCPICGMSLVPISAEVAGRVPAARDAVPGTARQGAYFCPMHPEVTSDDPAARCEKCGGMKLQPRGGEASARGAVPGLAPVSIEPERLQLIGMRTAQVVRRRLAPGLRAVGFVTADENRLTSVTVRFSGYVKDVRVKGAVAPVRRGQVLASVYSPELITPQLAFVTSVVWSNAAGSAPATDSATTAKDEPRRRLVLLGVAEEDLAEIERRLEPLQELKIRSPVDGFAVSSTLRNGSYVEPGAELFQIADLTKVWVIADVSEREMGRVRVGQPATVKVAAYPGRTFTGRVGFLYPALNPGTRTLQARIELGNRDLVLRPGMSGDVLIEVGGAEALAIPVEALVDTGETQYVFVAAGKGRLEPRRVEVGMRADGWVEVLSGLSGGETVVTTANFLIDSESRLRAALDGFAQQQR